MGAREREILLYVIRHAADMLASGAGREWRLEYIRKGAADLLARVREEREKAWNRPISADSGR